MKRDPTSFFGGQPLVGVGTCPRKGCPSDSHDVYFIKDGEGYVIKTVYTCRVCGADNTWTGTVPDEG